MGGTVNIFIRKGGALYNHWGLAEHAWPVHSFAPTDMVHQDSWSYMCMHGSSGEGGNRTRVTKGPNACMYKRHDPMTCRLSRRYLVCCHGDTCKRQHFLLT